MAPPIRAFVAVELDDALRQALGRVQQQIKSAFESGAPDARIAWVRPESMHLTLKFLGDIEESHVAGLHDAMADATRDSHPIAIPITRLGAFPRMRDPRNLWLGPPDEWLRSTDADRLRILASAIDTCASALGVPREARPFSPHLTLGRIKTGEREAGRVLQRLDGIAAALNAPLLVARVTLMHSQLDSKGAIHTRLWEIPLRAVS